jgi:hypothetical protein
MFHSVRATPGTSTKLNGKRKGLAKATRGFVLRRHGSGCWHLDAFPVGHTGIDKQMRIPRKAAPKKGRNE